jgi:hypothetical protein
MELNVDTIVEMRDVEGKTWAEIAEVMECHPLTAYKHYLRATTPTVKVKATAARVRKDRDKGVAWATIAAKYGISKAAVKRLHDAA